MPHVPPLRGTAGSDARECDADRSDATLTDTQALRDCEEKLQRVLAASRLALWDYDGSTHVFRFKGSGAADPVEPLASSVLAERVHGDDLPGLRSAFVTALKVPGTDFRAEYRLRRKDDSWGWNCSEGRVVERAGDGRALRMVGTSHDISARKQSETLIEGQKQLLALIADGRPLPEVLDALMRFVEAQSPGMLCSVLLLDADGLHLHHGAAPSLPLAYAQAIDGVAIGPSVGSCGTAAFRREAVVVEDIATDPLWVDYRELALGHGLRSCWSTPILDAHGRVLGTFAMYYTRPCRPRDEHLWLIDVATQTAAIAISHHAIGATLRHSVLALESTFEHMDQGISIVDKELRIVGTNRRFRELLDLPEKGRGRALRAASAPRCSRARGVRLRARARAARRRSRGARPRRRARAARPRGSAGRARRRAGSRRR